MLGAACNGDGARPAAAHAVSSPKGASEPAAAPVSPTSAPTTAPTTTVDRGTLAHRLQDAVDEFVASQPVPFGVVVIDESTGATATHLADRQVLSASLYKLFVAAELLRRIDGGELARDAPAGDGRGSTVDGCIEAMIVVSDNPCGSAGLRLVGYGALDTALHRDGYVATSLASPQRTSAADVARFFERARLGTLLGPGHESVTAELYNLLRHQQVNDRLPRGLPPGTPLAHKTGDRLEWAHDAGVMTTPRGDVVIVVLSGPWPRPCCDADRPGPGEARAFGAIAALGGMVYAVLS